MYTLLIVFLLCFIGSVILWAYGKVKEEFVALIVFISSVCFLLLPALIEKEATTAGLQIYAQYIDAEVYYNTEENKYFALTEKENSFVFWDLYELNEIDEQILKEKENNKTVTTRLLI